MRFAPWAVSFSTEKITVMAAARMPDEFFDTGAFVGLFHDGTPCPMAATMAACATISLLITRSAERGHVG